METVNIAPTWVWVMGVCLKLIEAGNQKKAEAGFVAEVEKLGPDVKLLIGDFRNGNQRVRKLAGELLLDKARRCDQAIAKAEGKS